MGSRSSNRKQRRAASNTPSIPLAHPNRDPPSSKTLVDLIAERQSSITGPAPSSNTQSNTDKFEFVTIDPSNLPKDDKPSDNGIPAGEGREHLSELPPLIDTLLLSFPLTTLHLTLAYLAAHQYAQSIPLRNLFRESGLVAFPMLTLLVHLAHGHIVSFGGGGRRNRTQKSRTASPASPETGSRTWMSRLYHAIFPPTPRTVAFLPLALLLGAKLISMTNNDPFYAVMRRAPAVGTLWVWSVLEMPVGAAIVGALAPLGWGVWWMGYGIA